MTTASLQSRLVRYDDLIPCRDAFIDTRTPGSDRKENFTIIGPGVSENPNQHIHIAEPHGFNIGGARQPPGCTNSQHSHETAEVFFVHSGTWAFRLGEHGDMAEIKLQPGDLISIPTQVFRGFENIGSEEGFLWTVLGGDDPGRVLWAPSVFDMAADFGLLLLENGNLVDLAAGDHPPANIAAMPRTTQLQIDLLRHIDNTELAACCVTGSSARSGRLIGADGLLKWPHGFNVDRLSIDADTPKDVKVLDVPDVIFLHSGALTVRVDGSTIELGPGDTFTIPLQSERAFLTQTHADFIRVTGESGHVA